MDTNHSDRVLAFDTLFTTSHIQMLKLLVGYIPPSVQGKMAVYIKFMELQHTLQMIARHPSIQISPCCNSDDSGNLTILLDEMLPFCRPEEKTQLQNLKNMFQTIENMQQMMEMIELMKEMAPEMFDGNGTGSMDFSQMMNMSQETDLSQMMEMMNMMQGMFTSSNENE